MSGAPARRKGAKRIVIHRANALRFGAPTPRPLRAVLIALDAATTTGSAIYVCGRLAAYANVQARDPHERRALLRDAVAFANLRELPVGLVCEAPFGGWASAALALNAVCSLWQDSWLALSQPKTSFLEVAVNAWRRELFGRKALSRTDAQRRERMVATERAWHDLPQFDHHDIPTDSCAAICLGQVSVRSSGVRAALGCELVKDRR